MTIELKKHKEHFRTLKEEKGYSELEKAIDAGLYITKRSVEGEGYNLLRSGKTKELIKKLPTIYGKFEALEQAGKKVKEKEELVEQARQGQRKRFIEYIPQNRKIVIPWLIIEGAAYLTGTIFFGINTPHSLEDIKIPADLPMIAGFVGNSFALITHLITIAAAHDAQQNRQTIRYCGLTGAIGVSLACLIDRNSRTRERIRKAKLHWAQRKKEKLKTKLGKGIKQVYYSTLPYTRNWFNKEKEQLAKLLEEGNKKFVSNLLQIEQITSPTDTLELRRDIETKLYQDLETLSKEEPEKIFNYYNEIEISKKAGIWTEHLEKKLKDITKKAMAHQHSLVKKHEETEKKLGQLEEDL